MTKLNAQVTTQAIIMNNNQKVLLLKRNKPGGKFTLPGGTIHEGEDIKSGLKRELQEETGLEIDILNPIWIWQSNHIGKDLLGVVFSSKSSDNLDKEVKLSDEHDSYRWFTKTELFSSEEVDPYIKREEFDKFWV